MKLRTGEPWMSARQYGQSLKGLTVNLLVNNIEAAVSFQRDILGVRIIYSDPDFAACAGYGSEWMLHADHTYDKHPMGNTITPAQPRGAGIELRLHGCNPDQAEAAAQRLGFEVLSPATDKGHGLREAFIRDKDGYIWVPDVHV